MNYQRLVRRMRQRIFDYDDMGKGEKADRVLRKAKDRFLDSDSHKKHIIQQKQARDEMLLRMWA